MPTQPFQLKFAGKAVRRTPPVGVSAFRIDFLSSPRAAVLFSLLCLCSLLTQPAFSAPSAPAATQPAVVHPNLLAHANKDFFWVAHVTAAPDNLPAGERTRIDYRPAGSDAWQNVSDAPLPGRVIALTDLSGQVVVLLENGEWLLLGEENNGSSGQPLPSGEKILTLCSDGETLWAAAGIATHAAATQPAATQSATTQPSATQPTTIPAGGNSALAIFVLKNSKWTPESGPAIPADVSADAPLSLATVDNTLYLVVERTDRTLDVYRQTSAEWHKIANVPGPAKIGAFKILAGLSPATLWVAGESADDLHTFPLTGEGKVAKLKEIKAPIPERTALYAVNAVRELGFVNGKFAEQKYNPQTFVASDTSDTISLPAPNGSPITTPLFSMALFVALVFAIFSSARRRRQLIEAAPTLENVVLADLLRRLAAGLIDALPFIAPLVIGFQTVHITEVSGTPAYTGTSLFFGSFAAAWFVYLIHTAASETLTGRTIGKWMLGLRVVRLDGATPDPVSLLVRNFLRVVDIGLLGVPLAFIAFSPLRQRIGDVAAGTIVIRDRLKPEGNLIDPPVEPESEPEKTASPAQPQSDPEPPTAG